jgi:hypothetical protein
VTALPVRAAAAEVYDTAHHRLVAFGGSGGSGYVDELWFYRFANAGAPADACADAAVDFDDDGLAGCDDPRLLEPVHAAVPARRDV